MWPASCVAFGLLESYVLLKDAQEAVKRFLIVNMGLVKASALISSSKTLLLSKSKESLPGFVDQLPLRHAEGCQGSILLALHYSYSWKAVDRAGAIFLLLEQGKGRLFSCLWLWCGGCSPLQVSALIQEACDGNKAAQSPPTVGKLRH